MALNTFNLVLLADGAVNTFISFSLVDGSVSIFYLILLANGFFEYRTRHDSLFKTILQGTLEGGGGGCGARPWSAEKMPDEQHQKVDTAAHARSAHKGLLQKRLKEDLC